MVHHETAVHHAKKAATPIGQLHQHFATSSPMAMLNESFKVSKMDAYRPRPGHDAAHQKHAGRKAKKKHMVSRVATVSVSRASLCKIVLEHS